MHDKIKLNKLAASLPKEIDLFLCCSSFENRCLSIPKAVSSISFGSVLVFEVEEFHNFVEGNKEVIRSIFDNVKDYPLSMFDPLKTVDSLISAIKSSRVNRPSVLIDLSTFTRESLLILLKFLKQFRDDFSDVFLVYNSAEMMSDTWLSRGAQSVRSVIGYSGELIPSRELHLTIIQGFEVERALGAIEYLEPSYISIGYGLPAQSINPVLAEKNEHFVTELEAFCGTQINTFTMSLFDVSQGISDLGNHMSGYEQFNNVILPLNTKLSTIAAGLYAHDNEGVQLCYTQMMDYNMTDYSVPSDECYLMSL